MTEKHWYLPMDSEQDWRKDIMLKGAYAPFLQQTANSSMTGFLG